MAKESEEINENIDNLKDTVRKSFAHVYARLKAQELKTLRQLEALRKHIQDDKEMKGNCVQNIKISYENESTLLDNIQLYGAIDLKNLNFDSSTFTLEDYISPNDDHMYSYKCIDELAKEMSDNLEAIKVEALRQITSTDNCVCCVSINSEEAVRKFQDIEEPSHQGNSIESTSTSSEVTNLEEKCSQSEETEVMESESEVTNDDDPILEKKIDPTDDWMNSIKNQTETEPSQVTDVMEHSTIVCS